MKLTLFIAVVIILAAGVIQLGGLASSIAGWLRFIPLDSEIHRNSWGIMALSVAIFVAFLALIPLRTKGSWKSRGIYLAFVVSLFGEMFGFPLTAYFASTYVGYPLFERDFIVYMWNIGMPVGSTISLLGVLLVATGWKEVYRGRGALVKSGVYAYVRHPQYLGLLLLTLGYLIHWPTIPTLLMWPLLCALYYWQARKEEQLLSERFGVEYMKYREKTPMLVPFKIRS